jgi:hypothetical protein
MKLLNLIRKEISKKLRWIFRFKIYRSLERRIRVKWMINRMPKFTRIVIQKRLGKNCKVCQQNHWINRSIWKKLVARRGFLNKWELCQIFSRWWRAKFGSERSDQNWTKETRVNRMDWFWPDSLKQICRQVFVELILSSFTINCCKLWLL